MGFSSRDDIINEITTNGKVDTRWVMKTAAAAAEAAGVWQTLWTGVGVPGAGTSSPGGTPGAAYDSDSDGDVNGAIWFADRSTDTKHILSFGATATQNGTLMLYDRLCGVGAITLASTGNKTVNSAALTRYTGTAASRNEVWLEVTTATTVTAPIVSLNQYTSADGTTGQSGGTVTFPAVATDLHSLIQVPLSAAKEGVRSVEVGLNVGTAATAGAATLLIIRPLVRIGVIASIWNEISLLDDTMELTQIFDNACLGLAYLASTTTAARVEAKINVAYG